MAKAYLPNSVGFNKGLLVVMDTGLGNRLLHSSTEMLDGFDAD